MANFALPFLATLLVGLTPSVQAPPAATEPDELVGLWVSETSFGPALRGNLTLTRDGARWRATLANAKTTFRRDGDTVRFAFPDNLGGFRGALEKGGRRITGFWLQPSGETKERPDTGGSGGRFDGSPPAVMVHSGAEWCTIRPWPNRIKPFVRVSVFPQASPAGFKRWPSAGARVRTA